MASDALWPSLTGEDPASSTSASNIPASQAEANRQPTLSPPPPPSLGRTNFVPPQISQGAATGTYVGQRVVEGRQRQQQADAQDRPRGCRPQRGRPREAA